MKERVFIEPGTRLVLGRTREGDLQQEWTILSRIGAGAATVCYAAECGGVRGRLKVFDPVYAEMSWEEYEGAYQRLRRLKRENPEASLLNNYIPPSEILYERDGEGEVTGLWIWTPDDKAGRRFDEYVKAVREQPGDKPEHKLYNILGVLITLADFLRALQDLGYTHLDIKPSNFIVTYDGAFDINPASISLFDIDSIWEMGTDLPAAIGTEGFQAPELAEGRPDFGSAIYSLGAILYYALSPEGADGNGYFQSRNFRKIPDFVDASPLIAASEINSSDTVRYLLVRILKNCLQRRLRDRYMDLEGLIEDLKRVRNCMLAEKGTDAVSASDELDGDILGGSAPDLMILDFLWRCPVTECLPEREAIPRHHSIDGDSSGKIVRVSRPVQSLRILSIGQDAAARRFADLSLQTAQAPGLLPHVTLMSLDPDLVKAAYLERRPALGQFIGIDEPAGSRSGRLDFEKAPPFISADDAWDESQGEIVSSFLREGGWHYVFISLGDETRNRRLAIRIADAASRAGIRLAAAYPAAAGNEEGLLIPEEGRALVIPLQQGLSRVHPDLERIGFHAHLTWAQVNADPEEAWKEFQKPYEYVSSVGFAASLPYRLRAAGILAREIWEDPAGTAFRFREKVLADQGEGSLYRDLIWTEHRRWCLEKACSGWQAPMAEGKPDLLYAVRHHAVRDEEARMQMCLIPSSREMPLCGPAYTRARYRWDFPGAYDEELDPLDRMSVELHRLFVREAEAFVRNNQLEQEEISVIRRRLAGASAQVQDAFDQYVTCIHNILRGNVVYARAYDRFRNTLLYHSEKDVPFYHKDISYRVKRITEALYVVRESCLYRDYKLNDKVLIDQIPFLLTRKTDPVLAAPLDKDGDRGLLKTASAAMVLNPAVFLCPVWAGRDDRAKDLIGKMTALSEAFLSRGLRSEIRFLLFVDRQMDQMEQDRLTACKSSDFTILRAGLFTGSREAAEAAVSCLAGTGLTFMDLTPGLFEDPDARALFHEKACALLPSFTWKEDGSAFRDLGGCREIEYYNTGTYLRVRDINILFGSRMLETGMPAMSSELEPMRRIRESAGQEGFGRLRRRLRDHIGKDDLVGELSFQPLRTWAATGMNIPAFMAGRIRVLLDQLAAEGLVLQDYQIWNISGDMCRVSVTGICPVRDCVLAVLAARREDLTETSLHTVCTREEGGHIRLRILCEAMEVRDLSLPEEDLRTILRDLEAGDFLYDLRFRDGAVSFCFMGRTVRNALLTPGYLEQVFVARDLWAASWFDDLGCGGEAGRRGNRPAALFVKGFCLATAVFEEDHVLLRAFSPADKEEVEPVRVPYGDGFWKKAEETIQAMCQERSFA